MIIIEGPDGAGKTTLVRKLSQELGLQVGQRATANRDELFRVTRQDTYTALGQAIGGKDPVKVWDRLFFSEMIYAPLMGRECEFKPREQRTIRAVLAALGIPVIMCYPPFDVVKQNIEREHQMEGVRASIEAIYKQYQSVTSGHPNTLWTDYTERQNVEGPRKKYVTYDMAVQVCQQYLEKRHERMWA